MKRLVVVVLSCFFVIVGCSHSRKLERAGNRIDRIAQRHPQLIQTQIDTIEVIEVDTIIRTRIETDSFFSAWSVGDTLILRDTVSKVEVRTIIGRDTIFQNITVNPDTVFVRDTITTTHEFQNIVIQDNWWNRAARKARRWWWLLIIGLCAGLLLRNVSKVKNIIMP